MVLKPYYIKTSVHTDWVWTKLSQHFQVVLQNRVKLTSPYGVHWVEENRSWRTKKQLKLCDLTSKW